MITKKQTVLMWFGLIVISAMVIPSFFVKPRVQLALSYLSQTNDAGRSLAFFAISNAGNVSISCYRSGTLEVLGQSKAERVACETRLSQLNPGGCDTAEIYLPGAMEKPWRFTMYFTKVEYFYLVLSSVAGGTLEQVRFSPSDCI
jgi:hypothetical protein